MKNSLIISAFIMLILVGSLTFIGINLTKKNGEYYNLETEITSAAKDYYAQYPNELPNSEIIITAYKLIETNFLDKLAVNDEECNGYVIIKKNYISHDYKPYINCKNYQTKKYNPQNEE